MKKRGLQYFSKEYLQRCKDLTPDQIIEFLENYRMAMNQVSEKCVLISLKIEPSLLKAFKVKAQLEGKRYQSLIKTLMRDYLE